MNTATQPIHHHAVVSIHGVFKTYRLGQHVIPALQGVDLTVQRGELLALTGPWHDHSLAASGWWASMALVALWLLRFDLACRTGIVRSGWALHTARCLRLGYAWLALAGGWGVANALRGLPLDATLVMFVSGIVLGWLGAWWTVSRHLRQIEPQ